MTRIVIEISETRKREWELALKQYLTPGLSQVQMDRISISKLAEAALYKLVGETYLRLYEKETL